MGLLGGQRGFRGGLFAARAVAAAAEVRDRPRLLEDRRAERLIGQALAAHRVPPAWRPFREPRGRPAARPPGAAAPAVPRASRPGRTDRREVGGRSRCTWPSRPDLLQAVHDVEQPLVARPAASGSCRPSGARSARRRRGRRPRPDAGGTGRPWRAGRGSGPVRGRTAPGRRARCRPRGRDRPRDRRRRRGRARRAECRHDRLPFGAQATVRTTVPPGGGAAEGPRAPVVRVRSVAAPRPPRPDAAADEVARIAAAAPDWATLAAAARPCVACPELAAVRQHVVVGDVPVGGRRSFALVGEAPGRHRGRDRPAVRREVRRAARPAARRGRAATARRPPSSTW